ncbi:Transposase [Pseudomonas nitroreducens]|nr:Transposase [Pseudomonas nitroreducens]
MKRFIEAVSREQVSLLPEYLDDFVAEDNRIRVVEAFVEQLDLVALEFDGVTPAVTGRPSYHPAVLLKVYIYGCLNRIQSSRCLERECQHNLELMWLTGQLAPDFKTIADFRRDNGKAIRTDCRQFVVLCRQLDLFSQSLVAIDGSKFKAVNNRDRNFTHGKLGTTHFLTRTLPRVSTEMSLHLLANNLKRLMSIFGVTGAMEVLRGLGLPFSCAFPPQTAVDRLRGHWQQLAGLESPVSCQRLVSRRVTSEWTPLVVFAVPVTPEDDRSTRAWPAVSWLVPMPCHWPVPMSGTLVPSLATELSTFSHWPLPQARLWLRAMSATPAVAIVASTLPPWRATTP